MCSGRAFSSRRNRSPEFQDLPASGPGQTVSVIVIMLLELVSRMIVMMLSVLVPVLVIMGTGITIMIVGMLVLVQVFMGMFVTVRVGMAHLSVTMFMLVFVYMGMTVQVLVLVFAFHITLLKRNGTITLQPIRLSGNGNSNRIEVNTPDFRSI